MSFFKPTLLKILKPIYIIILVIVVAASAFFGYKAYHRSQLQENFGRGAGGGQSDRFGNEQEGEIPKAEISAAAPVAMDRSSV